MAVDLGAGVAPLAWVEPEEAPPDWLPRALAALANPVRLRILKVLLATEGCFCGDLVARFGLAQSTVSHHLKTLKDAGLITGSERGTYVCYCADRRRIAEVKDALNRAL